MTEISYDIYLDGWRKIFTKVARARVLIFEILRDCKGIGGTRLRIYLTVQAAVVSPSTHGPVCVRRCVRFENPSNGHLSTEA